MKNISENHEAGSGDQSVPPRTALSDHFRYLDVLRKSGRTNMYAAATYLHHDRGIPLDDARKISGQWMETFDGETSAEDRAAKATGAST